MEIYNEQVHDLLQRKPKMFGQTATHSLKVREHPKEGPFVQGMRIESDLFIIYIKYSYVVLNLKNDLTCLKYACSLIWSVRV